PRPLRHDRHDLRHHRRRTQHRPRQGSECIMNMNWDEILKEQESDPGFAPVPDGKYPVRVEKAEATKASTGADMIKTQFVIVGGPHDGKKVFTNIVFSYNNPTAMRFTLRKLKALGVTREYLAANNPSTDQIA